MKSLYAHLSFLEDVLKQWEVLRPQVSQTLDVLLMSDGDQV